MAEFDDARATLLRDRAKYERLIAQVDEALTAIAAEPSAKESDISATVVTRRTRKRMSAAARKAVSDRMKKYWAARRSPKKR